MKNLNRNEEKINKYLKILKNAVKNDSTDKRYFKEILKAHKKLQNTSEKNTAKYEFFKDLHQDLFSAFFKYKPELNEASSMDYKYLINHAVMEGILKSDHYKELRALTKLDSLASAVGLEHINDDVMELIEKAQEENAADLQQIQELMEGENSDEGEESSNPGESKGANKLSFEEGEKRLKEFRKNIQENVKKQMKPFTAKVLEKAKKAVNSTQDTLTAWGLGSDPHYMKTGYQEKVQILDRLRSGKMRELSLILGRYKRLAMQAQREKVKKGIEEVFNIITGSDIHKTIPSELLKFCNPETEMLFFKDYTEGKLLQYDYHSKEKKQKGPIICCVDNSGSMMGQPEIKNFC
jgi:uncharacterized protein with von Willebrand factor type A (vWA) domain